MKEETHLSGALDVIDVTVAAYDKNVKEVLADKQVLARILKETTKEFGEYTIDEILLRLEDPTIDTIPVDYSPALKDLGKIDEGNTESVLPNEGLIRYDIRTRAYYGPDWKKMLLDLEAQKSSDPNKLGYHLEYRSEYYEGRVISEQKQREFYESDYDSLKKVRSIWISADAKKGQEYMEEYYMVREELYGHNHKPCETDLMRTIHIHVCSGAEAAKAPKLDNPLIAMLETLLSNEPPHIKKRELVEEHGMIMNMELEGRVNRMCNLGEGIREKAMEEGLAKGEAIGEARGLERGRNEGIKEGIKTGTLQSLLDLVRDNLLTIEVAAARVNMTTEEFMACM